jgi:alkylation response protein AidB-like acyl-CoA dehydrogenase
MPDTGYDEQQLAYADVIRSYCAEHDDAWTDPAAAARIDPQLWSGLGELGVLGLTAVGSGAGALDVVAAHEALGSAGCPGPLGPTALVVAALSEVGGSVAEDIDALMSGRLIATVGTSERMPWATRADLVFDGGDPADLAVFDPLRPSSRGLWRCRQVDVVDEMISLGHEPAARVRITRGEFLEVGTRAAILAELARAAYLVGAGRRVVTDVVDYVRSRRQFHRALSQFQAVAHPLADCDSHLAAAAALVRRAASRLDQTDRSGSAVPMSAFDAGTALASAARASRRAVYQAHQGYGGIGFAAEGPLAWIGSRVGQLSTEAQQAWRARPLSELLARS